jgi:hypothetical protein
MVELTYIDSLSLLENDHCIHNSHDNAHLILMPGHVLFIHVEETIFVKFGDIQQIIL